MRAVFFAGAMAILLVSCASGPPTESVSATILEGAVWNGEPLVQTRYGYVQGHRDQQNTLVWKAIPYARPPVGDLRWRAPQAPEPWSGIRNSRRFSSPSVQYHPLLPGRIVGSEDCLYLNIWRPAGAEQNLPVYVWIHGGGNSMGSATLVPDYYGHQLAARSNVVYVSVNYRLGPLGWFLHQALQADADPADASGNYGTLDLIEALKWINDNIRAFGGDPERVLISGESAGGANVLSLVISPLAEGLYTRALCQSGYPGVSSFQDGYASSREAVAQLLILDRKAATMTEALTVAEAIPLEEMRRHLRAKSARQILRCYDAGFGGMVSNPAIFGDGFIIPENGYDVLQTGEYANKVPIILGSNRDELRLFLAFSREWRTARSQAVARYGSALWKARGVDSVARKLASHPDQPPVYVYHFCWGAVNEKGESPLPGSWGSRLGAFHTLEIPFFLGTDTVDGPAFTWLFRRSSDAGRKLLSNAMMDYVASFVYSGSPNRGGTALPRWLPWTNQVEGPKGIVLDVRGHQPEIRMTAVEVTHEAVYRALYAESPRLFAETFAYIAGPTLSH